MPVVPELGQVQLAVGAVEVFWQSHAHKPAQADGNIGIAGKIEEDLKTVGVQHQQQPAVAGCLWHNCLVDGYQRQCVSNHKFLKHTNDDAPAAFHEIIPV